MYRIAVDKLATWNRTNGAQQTWQKASPNAQSKSSDCGSTKNSPTVKIWQPLGSVVGIAAMNEAFLFNRFSRRRSDGSPTVRIRSDGATLYACSYYRQWRNEKRTPFTLRHSRSVQVLFFQLIFPNELFFKLNFPNGMKWRMSMIPLDSIAHRVHVAHTP